MTEEKLIVAARPTTYEGQLAVLLQFLDGDWTFWLAESHSDVTELMKLVGKTVRFEADEVTQSGTLH
jgi:hypothetical protein